jgi:hypothetical protein
VEPENRVTDQHQESFASIVARNDIHLNLSAESTSHSTVFFSRNESANNTFCHGLSTKRTRQIFQLKEQLGKSAQEVHQVASKLISSAVDSR